MPIDSEQMTHEEMAKAAKDHFCATCGGPLNVAWSAQDNGFILRCKDLKHSTITRHQPKSEYELAHERAWREVRHMDSKSLTTMDNTQMLARVEMAKFPQDLTPADKRLLAEVAISYGLDPLMNEVSIYQGRPFVSIDGRYRLAQETGELDGVESRPATKQEREDWEIPAGDRFFRAEVWRKGATRPFVGWGRVLQSEEIGGKGFKPVEKNPQRMAEKRAEAQALRKAFHIPLPSIEDIGYRDGRVVDVSTGELIETPRLTEGNGHGTRQDMPPASEVTLAPVIPQPEPAKDTAVKQGTLGELTGKDKLTLSVRDNKPMLKTDKNVLDWLTSGPHGVTKEQIEADPAKVWEEVRGKL